MTHRFLYVILLMLTISTGKILGQAPQTGKTPEERIHSHDYDTRFDAVMELSDKQESIGILTQVLSNDSSPAIKALAATKLGQSRLSEAANPLLAALNNLAKTKKKDRDTFLQRTIVYALGNFHDSSVLTTLIAQLADQEPVIRSAAVDSLGKIQDQTAIMPLIQSLRDKESFVRARAAAALGSLKNSQAVTPLVSVLTRDESAEVRREAAQSLGIIGGAEAHRALESALSDKDPFVQRYSWEALHPEKPI